MRNNFIYAFFVSNRIAFLNRPHLSPPSHSLKYINTYKSLVKINIKFISFDEIEQ